MYRVIKLKQSLQSKRLSTRIIGCGLFVVLLTAVFVFADTKIAYAGCGTWDISCQWTSLWRDVARSTAKLFAESFVHWMGMSVTGAIDLVDISTMRTTALQPQTVTAEIFGQTFSVLVVLGYMKWIVGAVGTIMLVIYFGRLAWMNKSGAPTEGLKTLFYICIGMLITFSAISLTTTVLEHSGGSPRNIIEWVTGQIWPFMLISMLFGVMITAIKVMIEPNGKPIKELLESFLVIIAVVNLASILVILLGAITDKLAMTIISNAFDCNYADETCLGRHISDAFSMDNTGWFLIMLFCLIAVIVVLIQSIIFVGRTIMMVCVIGTLGISASLRYTKMGKEGLEKCLTWIFSLLMYKPLVAIIYSISLKVMMNSPEDGFWEFIYCIAGAFMAIIGMPMLIKLMMPAAASVTDASSGFGLGQIMQPMYLLSTMKNLFGGSGGGGGNNQGGPRGANGQGGQR